MELEISNLLAKLSIESSSSSNGFVSSDGSLPSPMMSEANALIAARATAIEAFNKKFENTFKFSPVSLDVKKSLIETLYEFLTASSNKLKWSVNGQQHGASQDAVAAAATAASFSAHFENHTRLICSCLDTVRLLSRDTDGIDVFEHDDLLSLIQSIANLTTEDSKIIQIYPPACTMSTSATVTSSADLLDQEVIVVAGLKSISNLIYNSKYAQEFYARKGVAESITMHLKQFSPESIRQPGLNQNRINIMIFNLRILFLLTIFNKELRIKLKEKLQVITYLIEIIDQIMKERLSSPAFMGGGFNNDNDAAQTTTNNGANQHVSISIVDNSTQQQQQQSTSAQFQEDPNDYCYLKRTDIDYINEILKILYNITMDTASVKANAVATMTSTPSSGKPAAPATGDMLEEEEAHLMHLVSVLRDLMTCKQEDESATSSDPHNLLAHLNKMNDLHSNIINLLTNMPSICFEELMTPCLNMIAGPSPLSDEHLLKMINPVIIKSSAFISTDNLNVRIAHNRKRLSRRSKRIKKQQPVSPASSTTNVSDTAEPAVSTSPSRPPSTSSNGGKKGRVHLSPPNNANDCIVGQDEDFEFEGKNMEAIGMILSFMTRNVNIYLKKPAGYNADQLYPVLLLLSLMSKANATIRRYCRFKVLPPLADEILKLPQEGNSIRNRLVTLMTDANIQVKRLSAQFLFILCKESVGRLVKYTGYGNAAGLLAEAGLMLSKHGDRAAYSSDSDDSDTEEYKKHEEHVNPITGRAEPNAEAIKREIIDSMSDEQKEYEALELVKTIDKLTRMGAGGIKPATIGSDGKPLEIEHVLQLQQDSKKVGKKSGSDEE